MVVVDSKYLLAFENAVVSSIAYLSQFEHLGSECWEPALWTGGEVAPHHVIPGGHAVGEGTLAGGAVKLGLKDFRRAVGTGGEVGLRLTHYYELMQGGKSLPLAEYVSIE